MNFGFRYHLASLLAVFFSLVLGILIGGALFPDHALVDEQAALISELEERLKTVQSNLANLQEEADFLSLAWGQLRDSVVRDQLIDKTLVLVQEELHDNTALAATLRFAGAEVKEITLEQLEELNLQDDLSFIFRLVNPEPSPELLARVEQLGAAGVHLSFVWEKEPSPALKALPTSLQVDHIDTSLGEIALILGLISESHGYFGRGQGAKGLFP